MTTTLTSKQKQVFDFLCHQIKVKRQTPTLREIASHFGFASIGSVQDHLKALSQKGFIKLNEGKSRAIEILNETIFSIPILGHVQAGMPTLAVENIEGYLDLDKLIFAGSGVFGLRVKGDSMRDAGILQGDMVLVRQQSTAEVGEIVIAMVGDDEATIKYLSKRDGKYFLDPANPKYNPIPLNEECSIIGQVLTVIRNIG
jgi:repressor LexA